MNKLLEAVRALPPNERLQLLEILRRQYPTVAVSRRPAIHPSSVIGLFAEDADLLDEVCTSALQARERDPLRAGKP